MIPIVWMLQSLHACAAASGAGFVEISAGYSTRYNDNLLVPGSFISKYQADASGLLAYKRYYNLSNRFNDWISVASCATMSRDHREDYLSSAIRKSIELGASALLFLCINNSDQEDFLTATTEAATVTAGESEFPVFLVDAIDNVSAVIEFLGNHLITKAKIHSCNDHTVASQGNKMATVSVWTACSRTRNPLSMRMDGVFCAGSSSSKDTVVAVWNASSVALLSIFVALLLRMKQFFYNMPMIRFFPYREKEPYECDTELVKRLLPAREALNQELGNLCPICLDTVNFKQSLRCLPCSHYFHVECIDEWLLIAPSCPLCKQGAFGTLTQN